jgi:hypothetical protein
MIVSHSHQIVYMPPPKTGTTTITQLLKKEYDGFVWDEWEPDIYTYNGILIKQPKHLVHLPKALSHYFVFGSVRNPYSREVSRYYWKYYRNHVKVTFEEHIMEITKEANSDWYYLRQNSDYVPPQGCVKFKLDAVVRLEHIEKDLASLPFINSPVCLPRLNTTTEKHPIDYTPELARKIKEEFAIDFEKFGYSLRPPLKILI